MIWLMIAAPAVAAVFVACGVFLISFGRDVGVATEDQE